MLQMKKGIMNSEMLEEESHGKQNSQEVRKILCEMDVVARNAPSLFWLADCHFCLLQASNSFYDPGLRAGELCTVTFASWQI